MKNKIDVIENNIKFCHSIIESVPSPIDKKLVTQT